MGPATQGMDKGRNAKIAAFPLLTPRLISRMHSRPSLLFPTPAPPVLRPPGNDPCSPKAGVMPAYPKTPAPHPGRLHCANFPSGVLACARDARFLVCLQHLARRSWQACLLQLSCTCGLTFAACEQLRVWSDLRCCAVFECDLVREVSLSAPPILPSPQRFSRAGCLCAAPGRLWRSITCQAGASYANFVCWELRGLDLASACSNQGRRSSSSA